MKFGHLDEVSRIDFSLPPDHPITAKVLKGKPTKHPKIFSGLAEWGNEGFPGKIYPKSAKAKDYLKLYGEQFKIVELNATGYRIPSVKTVEGWIGAVGKDFIFCPKVSQPISQVKPLGRDKNALQQFYDAMRAFGDHLGTIFLQLHPTFSPNRYDDLVNFLGEWDPTFPLHVELRHADWFSNPEVLNNLFEEMRKLKIGTVITDTPGRRDVLHMGLTIPSAFIRFEGNELHRTDFTRIDAWANHLKHWIDRGLETIYFFPHTTTKALTPEMSNHFIAKMNTLCGLDLKPAKIIGDSKDGLRLEL
jgi:uncharacterized protein YecE (DUF72 family)